MIHLEQRNPQVGYILNIDAHSHWKDKHGMLSDSVSFAKYDTDDLIDVRVNVTDTLERLGITVEQYDHELYTDTNSGITKMVFVVHVLMPNDAQVYDKLYQVSQDLAQDCIAVAKVQRGKVVGGFLCGSHTLPYGHFDINKFATGFQYGKN